MLSLPEAQWELIDNRLPIRKGQGTTTIVITPNTSRRDCIEKVVISDSSENKTSITKIKRNLRFNGSFIEIPLDKTDKDKFQTGEISIDIFEPISNRPLNTQQLTFKLLDKKPTVDKFVVRKGETVGKCQSRSLLSET